MPFSVYLLELYFNALLMLLCHLSYNDLCMHIYIFQMIIPSFVCVCLWVEDRLGVYRGEWRWHVSIFNKVVDTNP